MTPEQHLERLRGRLTGISDAQLEHWCAEQAGVEASVAALRRQVERAPAHGGVPGPVAAARARLLATPVRRLRLKLEGQVAECVAEVEGELASRGITWRPQWYVGTSGLVDGEFWTTDRANSINVPWYLANDELWREVNDVRVHYTRDDVLRVMRHEVGHALGYAFELWRRADWKAAFGDFERPYNDAYTPDPDSHDFVRYLHDTGPSQNAHYAQKHPDEDWAETFANWLDPSADPNQYIDWPVASAKLALVQDLLVTQGLAYGEAPNKETGKHEPYTQVEGTVGEFVGDWEPADLAGTPLLQLQTLAGLETVARMGALHLAGLAPGGEGVAGPGMEASLRAACAAAEAWGILAFDGGVVRSFALWERQGPPPGLLLLQVIDVRPQAWWSDYPGRKDLYVAAVLRNLSWGRQPEQESVT